MLWGRGSVVNDRLYTLSSFGVGCFSFRASSSRASGLQGVLGCRATGVKAYGGSRSANFFPVSMRL